MGEYIIWFGMVPLIFSNPSFQISYFRLLKVSTQTRRKMLLIFLILCQMYLAHDSNTKQLGDSHECATPELDESCVVHGRYDMLPSMRALASQFKADSICFVICLAPLVQDEL